MPDSNAFHLEGVKPIADKNQNKLKSVAESFKNETIILLANKTHDLPEKHSPSLTKSENDLLSSVKANAEKLSMNKDEMKMHGKTWRSSKYAVPEKPSHLRNIADHPKRESTWHKNFKDLHKVLGSVNGPKENSFNGFDIVLVDIPPSYSRLRWDKPHINSLTSPAIRYVPMKSSPTVFDFFLGLNSLAGNFLTDPDETENGIFFQQSLENPYWNHRLSFDRLMSPPVVHKKAAKVAHGDRIAKDVNSTQFIDKLTEPCTCGERKNLL